MILSTRLPRSNYYSYKFYEMLKLLIELIMNLTACVDTERQKYGTSRGQVLIFLELYVQV